MAETLLTIKPLVVAFLGGILPALVWLWFWHRQDKDCPEPRGLVILSFMAGMVVVFFVAPFQKLVHVSMPQIMDVFAQLTQGSALANISMTSVERFLWAGIEEIAKYGVILFVALRSYSFNEPIDAIIYMITGALGFAAMENTLYLLKDMVASGTLDIILNGNMRFIGATLVHTVSSAFVGVAIAMAFYAPRFLQKIAALLGIIGATLLHAYFNLSIMDVTGTLNVLQVFSKFWIVIIVLIILIQIVKRVARPTDTCPIQ